MRFITTFLIAIGMFVFITPMTWSQNHTLQYNKVKLISSTEETVPADKVWKIENILPSSRLTTAVTNGNATTNHIIIVNSITIYVATSDAIGSLYGNGQTGFAIEASNITGSPIWLPAGTTLKTGTGVQYISVIEFNEVP
jgi:hypothetical protein